MEHVSDPLLRAEAVANLDSTNHESEGLSRLDVGQAAPIAEESHQHVLSLTPPNEIAPDDQEENDDKDMHSTDYNADAEPPSFPSDKEIPTIEFIEEATVSKPSFELTDEADLEAARTETIDEETLKLSSANVTNEPSQDPTPAAAATSDFDKNFRRPHKKLRRIFRVPQLPTTLEPLNDPTRPQQNQLTHVLRARQTQ